MILLAFVLCCFAPAVLAWLALRMPWAWEQAVRLLDRWRPVGPLTPPIEEIAADLQRLSGRLRALHEHEAIPGRMLRMRSTTAAYDETLLLACRALELPAPRDCAPMTAVQRLETEANLVGAGLRW